jgi:anthranilate phosphoribosyltransferase
MTFEQSLEVFDKLFENQLSENEAKELLIELYQRGESYEEIAAAAKSMREHSIKLDVSDDLQEKLIDNCGTGGDKSGSFNISTTVSLLLASCGSYVAKHGNRSITSKSGSADMLEILGINLNLSPQNQVKMLEEIGFAFIFAINHHPAMKYIMPIRKSLSHRSIFNILGPLSNPSGVKKQLIGVFDYSFTEKMTEALKTLGSKSAYVVSSKDGLDEISISDITYYSKLENNIVSSSEINPEHYGIKLSPLESIKGGEAKDNAKITTDILNGQLQGPKLDVVLINTAVALVVDGKARDIQDGIAIAKDAIDSKKAKEHLKKIIEVSSKF